MFSSSFRGIDWPGASGLPEDGRYPRQVSQDDRPQQQSDVQSLWCACGGAHLGHVRGISPTERNAVAQTFKFPRTNGGRRPKLDDTPLPSNQDRKQQNWRGGRYDQSRLETMSVDGAVFERLQPQDKPLLNPNYAEHLVFSVVLPQIRR